MELTQIYDGKAKTVFETGTPGQLVQRFKDSATAFNGAKFANIDSKGELNNAISSTVFRYLRHNGLESHYLDTLNKRDMLVRGVEIVKLEVVTRNIVAGSLSKRLGVDEGVVVEGSPIVEFYYKNDALGDPLVNESHIRYLGVATPDELAQITAHALRVNALLIAFWAKCGLRLVDFKLEYGRLDGQILLADEVSPDTSRLWAEGTNQKMDKDVFRRDLADLTETYRAVFARIQAAWPEFVPAVG